MFTFTLLSVLVFTLSGSRAGEEASLVETPCKDKHCSHACVLGRGDPTCACPTGMFLGSDQKTCQESASVLLAMYRGIKLVQDGGPEPRLVIPVKTSAFDFHFGRKEVFLYHNNSILKYPLTDTLDSTTTPTTVARTETAVSSLALDWENDDLYMISQQRSAVEAVSVQGRHQRVVVSHNDVESSANWNNIVVDPYARKLFWLGSEGLHSSDLDGKNFQSNLGAWRVRLEDVALDTGSQLVYVVGGGVVGRARYDGTQAGELLSLGQDGGKVFGLGVLGNTLYWESSHEGENLYKCQLPQGEDRLTQGPREATVTLVEELNQVVFDMKVFSASVQRAPPRRMVLS